MTPVTLINEARADGVSLTLSPSGTIKATGDTAAINRWLSTIRACKADIVEALQTRCESTATAPRWWRVQRQNGEWLELPGFAGNDQAAIRAQYPTALVVEPIATHPPAAPMTEAEEHAIRAWLTWAGETNADTIAEVLDGCQQDADILAGYIRSAAENKIY